MLGKIKDIFCDRACYGLAYRRLTEESKSSPLVDLSRGGFSFVKPSRKYWYADPMLLDYKDATYVYAEQFDRLKKKGNIAVARIDETGRIGKWKTVLSDSFHFSFPNVFLYKNDYYMIPETSEDKSVRIYKMQDNPFEWVMIKKYEISNCVDTSVFIEGETAYLLTCELNIDNPLETRFRLFSCQSFPDSELVELPIQNIDAYDKSTRNGGNFFFIGDRMFRIAQISVDTYYGKFFEIRKVKSCSEDGIDEELIQRVDCSDIKYGLKPYFKVTGTHTYSRCREYEVVDLCGTYFSFGNLINRLKKRAK